MYKNILMDRFDPYFMPQSHTSKSLIVCQLPSIMVLTHIGTVKLQKVSEVYHKVNEAN